ncbi:MAG: hypothetical protein OS112_03880 [Methanoregula sp.]|nr:MAG: hypothetical protein OS112_03880 [Methanoregula sp.]
MENDVLITAIFVGAGLLAYVVIPGLLVAEGCRPETREAFRLRCMWDRVLGYMSSSGKNEEY